MDSSTFSLETALNQLRETVEKMQMSSLNFDENIRLFREGTEIVKNCRKYLDESELMIRQLIDEEKK
ncbi:MAG: exodeoxyribonuclease VII small subunit [Bacteroidia bacterium]|nr:exodeoxyribonuclease VII small subunit [Bacteroidia bacterium]